ncbi:hypothetical protein EON65_56025 [archaeon]|nr:MAG: hypothetical protein EON65_56025 [archaeon]
MPTQPRSCTGAPPNTGSNQGRKTHRKTQLQSSSSQSSPLNKMKIAFNIKVVYILNTTKDTYGSKSTWSYHSSAPFCEASTIVT